MQSFTAVVRTLLVRIRALKASRSGNPWPPPAAAGGDEPLYRVAPTMWGAAAAAAGAGVEGPAVAAVRRPAPTRARRRRLELTAYGLPVPRGLPAT